ncbi:tRNA exportin [Trypanosoma cruzi cruzi]|uniref:Exportin-T n=1 Tax=Trypanosoma cruzi TaxID=5693 RepID=A0A2V2VB96_TRYCR|nr:tRNA exportin [Trypanosoma cruzi cruzi]PWU92882.1 putative exportin-T [Trypanosoma cruzi]
MTSPLSTNYFTRAMELAHMCIPDVTPQERLEAERYLMSLRATADGLNLSFHIISNEPVHDLRCFWAFNTIMHHLPAIAGSINDAQAEELYRTLFSFIYRYFFSSSTLQRQPMDFLANKHAQLMVAGLQEFFPSRWTLFFDDAFELFERRGILPHVGDAVTVYVLRLFEYIDERVVSVRAQTNRCRELRARDMELKDAMRENVMPRAVTTWYVILCDCRIRAPEIAKLCLTVVQTYIEWVDFTLFITAEWINLLYFLVTAPAVRGAACECIFSLVEKKQLPVAKLESLRTLNIVDALPRIASLLQVPPKTEEDVNFLEVVARLTRAVAEQFLFLFENISAATADNGSPNRLCNSPMKHHSVHASEKGEVIFNGRTVMGACYTTAKNSSNSKGEVPLQSDGVLSRDCIDNVRAALDTILTYLLRLLSINHSDVSNTLLPFVQVYLKSAALNEERAGEILLRLYDHSLIQGIAEEEDQMWLDDIIDQRKQIHNLIRLLFRRYPTIVLQHLRLCVAQASTPVSAEECFRNKMDNQNRGDHQEHHLHVGNASVMGGGGAKNRHAEEIEATLRYLYEIGESVRMERLRNAEDEFSQLVCTVVSSECIAQCPCAVVHLSYFEVLDRYYAFFIYHSEWIPLLLQRLLLMPYGVTNRHPRVRARVCYLFGHLVQLLKTHLSLHKKSIVNALQDIFSSGVLQPSDCCELYEATGNVLSSMSRTSTSGMDDGAMVVRFIEIMLQGLRDASSLVSSHQVMTGDSSACSEAVADQISFLTALAKGLRGGGGGGVAGPNDTMTHQGGGSSGEGVDVVIVKTFYSVTNDVMKALIAWHASASVRDRAAQYFTQMIHILPFECMDAYFTAYITNWLAWMEAIPELTKLLRLLFHFIHRSGSCVGALLTTTLPVVLHKVTAVGDLLISPEEMELVSESTREKREVYRQLFAVLQGATQAGCVPIILSLPSANLMPLLSQLIAAMHLPVETELPKLALQIITKITTTGWAEGVGPPKDYATKDRPYNHHPHGGTNKSDNSTMNMGNNLCDGGGDGAWTLFVLNEVVPTLLQRFLLPEFDVKDAKNFLLIGEFGLLLKALMNRLGPSDPSLYMLLYNMLQPLVGEEEVTGLVTALQKEPNFSTEMRMRFRNMLQAAKERQTTGSDMK